MAAAPRDRAQPRIGPPPARDEILPPTVGYTRSRRFKTGRTEQFNVRVQAGFKARIEQLAALEKETLGALLEAMLAAYEAGAAASKLGIPVADLRAGRHRALDLFATDEVFNTIGKVAALRKLTSSGLVEDLLAREVARLDPHGRTFGVNVKR